MLKVGVVGAGHLGKIHLKLLNQSDKYQLIGFHDTNKEASIKVAEEFGYTYYEDLDTLLEAIDVINIVCPTVAHYAIAKKAISSKKHVFIEKPITHHLEEAKELIALCKTHNVKGQVGHVERFNPAFLATKDKIKQPMFIETHRLAEFNPRGTDVPVVLDLMIHDIDVILSVVNSEVVNINSSGVAVISETPDIANARLEFENGCVANLTSSRISMKNMRKSRFFQKDAYISIDFLEKNCEIVKMKNAPEIPGEFDMILENAEGIKKQIYFENPKPENNNAILEEVNAFADAINNNTSPAVTLEQATKALEVALGIIQNFKTA